MPIKLITDATVEPITLAEAKDQCRVDADLTADDALITGAIIGARMYCENKIKRALVAQVWEKTLDYFPGAYCAAWPTVPIGALSIPLALPPIISVASVKYVDTAGVLQTLDPTCYVLDDRTLPGWLAPAYGYMWPSTRAELGAVRIRFTAGYGTDATTVPAIVKVWMKLAVALIYRDRETADLTALDRMLDPVCVKVLV